MYFPFLGYAYEKKKRIAQKLRRTILPHFGLVTFTYRFWKESRTAFIFLDFILGILESLNLGILESWYLGILGSRNLGILESWSLGVLESWA